MKKVYLLLWSVLVLSLVQFPVENTSPKAYAKPLAQTAEVTLNLPAQVFIGSNFSFTASFDNSSARGYGPFIDLVFPVNGADGAAGTDTPDGIDFIDATYLDSPVIVEERVFPGGAGCVDHPYAVDDTHTPIQVCGMPGDKLVAIQLPFGSFTPDQPPAEIVINATLSPLADLGTPLTIRARGGFEFGSDALDNWCCDPVILTHPNPDSSTWTPASTVPQLITLSKSNDGPEGETNTGPNYPRQYTITVEVASGQTITNLEITDYIDDNIVVTGVSNFSPAGSVLSLGGGAPTFPYGPVSSVSPNNELVVRFPSVTGTASFVVRFYVLDVDAAGSSILDPDTGVSTITENYATARATWPPLDPRDPQTPIQIEDPCPTCHNTLIDRSIAIQKTVREYNGNPIRSGAVLEYTLNFQISDYFIFDDIIITDTLSDGQRIDPASRPTFAVTDFNGNVTGNMDLPVATTDTCALAVGNVLIDQSQIGNNDNPATDGSTTITFCVSKALIGLGGADGILEGGRVSGVNGAAQGHITFLVNVLDAFSDIYPSGDPSVDHGDVLTNDAIITGAVLDNATGLPTGSRSTDSTHAEVTISQGTLTKTLYQINGAAPVGSPPLISPGDTVTYRLQYHMPSSDFEEFVVTDYLPLPIFDAAEITIFDDVRSASAPPAGHAQFGPADMFRTNCEAAAGELNCLKDVNPPTGSPVPGLTADIGSNSIEFFYGDFDDPNNVDTIIDILFTITVRNDPFADGLYLTNQAHSHEGSTNASDQDADGIVQVQLGEPVLMIRKGVTDSDNPDEMFSYPASGTNPASPDVPAIPVGSDDLSNPNVANADIDGVDASDIVEFAIVLENSGRSGAFDIDIQDTLLPGFVIPAGGINLQIRRGDGTVLTSIPLGAVGPETSGLFGDGLRINPPVASEPVCQKAHPANGTNTVVITYQLQVDPNIAPGTVIPNTAALINYAGTPGGPNHLDDGTGGVQPITDGSSTTIAEPTITKAPGAATVAVGQTFDYTLTLTIPEGQMAAMQLIDDLSAGQAFVRCASITPSNGALSSSLGFANVCTNPTVDPGGGRITFDFGTLTNANADNGIDETLTIVYTVVPLNLAAVQNGTDLTNNVTLNWTGGSVTTSAVVVDVVEPGLQIAKNVTPTTGVDAGDTVTFTVTIRHTTASNATAYDVVLLDTIPAGLTYGGSVGLGTCNDSPDVGPTEAGGVVSATWNDFPVGRSCAITFTAQLAGSVYPGQVITNTAGVTWTSVSGPAAGNNTYNPNGVERTGNATMPGEENNYSATDPANVTVTSPALTKTIVQTSEAFTSETATPRPVVIGEIVRYRLTVQLPEGTSPTVELRDTLPTGLQFLNDGTAKVAFVSNTGLTSSTLTAAATGCDDVGTALHFTGSAAVTPECTLPVSAIFDANGGLPFNQGDDPYFLLGMLTNADRNDGNSEYVIVEFNALVYNVASNSLGVGRNNQFTARINGTNRGNASVLVRIAEPQFSITKVATPDQGDAGDTISFTLTITNPAGTDRMTGFEAHITDILPGDYTLDLDSVSGVGSGGVVGLTDNSAGNTIDYTLTTFPVGGQVVITYDAILKTSVTPGQTLDNTAKVTWTSLPGANGTTSNPTGSNTPGDSGDGNGERDGSGAPLNDYTASITETVTIDRPQPQKSIVATSETLTNETADPRPLAIGEIVRYRLVTTIPEGTSNNVQLVDTMTTGLELVDNTRVKVSFTATDPMTIAPDLSDADDAVDPPTFTLPAGRISIAGNEVTFNLGNLVNNDTDDDDEFVILEFNALVTNTATTNLDEIKANFFDVVINGNNRGTSTAVNTIIVEPFLNVTKTATPIAGDAGDTINFTLTITNPVAADRAVGFEAHITDILPGDYTLNLGSITPTLAGCGSPSVTNNSAGNTIDFTLSEVPLACTVDIVYSATLNTSVTPGQTLDNTATVTWTSLPGAGTASNPTGSNTPESSGQDQGERDHQSGINAANDYTDSDNATVTVNNTIILNKTATTPHTIGALVTYTLTLDLIEGTTNNVVITDTLPNNTDFVDGSQTITFGTSGSTTSSSIFTFTDPILTINLGNVTIPFSANPNTVIVTFQARVMNSGVNVNGNTKTNTATVTAEGGMNASGNADTTLIEPALVIDKSVTVPPNIDAEDTFTYTISIYHAPGSTSDAFDVTITDIIPADLTYAGNVLSVSGVLPTVDDTGAPTITFSWDTIPLSVTAATPYMFTFDVTLNNSAASGQTITNTADLRWDSQDGDSAPEERVYTNDAETPFTLNSAPAINKGITATSLVETGDGQHTPGITDLAVGETVTYQLIVTLIEGTDTIIVTDDLPDVLSVVSSRVVSIGGNISGSLLAVGASGAHNDVNRVDSLPDQAVFNFGTVVNAADNFVDADDQIVVEVVARVEDVPANASTGIALINDGTVTHNTGTARDSESVEIVEPLLEIEKSSVTTAVDGGDTFTYTITVNHAPGSTADAFGVVITDVLPANLTYAGNVQLVSGILPTVETSGAPTLTFNWDTIPLTAATPYSFSFDVTVAESVVTGGHITNTASLNYDNLEGPGGRAESDSDDYTVAVGSSFALTKESTTPHTIGDLVTYTLTVDLIEGITTNVTITDALPDNIDFVDGPQTIGFGTSGSSTTQALFTYVDPMLLINLGNVTIPSGASPNTVIITFQARVMNTPVQNVNGAVKTNSATATADGGLNVSDTAETTLAEPNLVIEKTVSPAHPSVGDTVTYTISVYHAASSTADAFDITITDLLPAELTYAGNVQSISGISPTVNASGAPTLIFGWDNVPLSVTAAAPYRFSFDAEVNNAASLGQTITNTANLVYDSQDGNSAPEERSYNASGSADFTMPNLTVAKTDAIVIDNDSDGEVDPGDTIGYTITLTNNGTAINNAVFADTPDPNTALVSGSVTVSDPAAVVVTGNNAGDATVRVNLNTFGSGATVTIAFRVQVNAPLANSITEIANQGEISGDGTPPIPSDDSDTPARDDATITPVRGAPLIEANKVDALLIDQNGDGGPSFDDTLEYTINITNTGVRDAQNVIFTDTPDLNTTLVAGSVTVSDLAGLVVTGNNPGDTSLRVEIPVIASATGSASITFQVTINTPLNPPTTLQVNNQGLVSGDNFTDEPTDDSDTPEDDDETITPLSPAPLVEASKVDALLIDVIGNGTANPGDTLEYTVALINNGNGDATGVNFTDQPDPNTTLVAGSVTVSDPAATVLIGNNPGNRRVRVTLTTLPAGTTVLITFQVTINDPLPDGLAQVSNQGMVRGGNFGDLVTDDTDTPEDNDTTTTPVGDYQEMESEKTDNLVDDLNGDGLANPGDMLQYTVALVNNGSGKATNVIFTDTPDPNTTLIAGSVTASNPGSSIITGNNPGDTSIAIEIGTIRPGQQIRITFQVTINNPLPAGVTGVSNQGLIAGSNIEDTLTDDPDTPKINDTTDTPIGAASTDPDLVVTKVDTLWDDTPSNDGVPSPGDTLQYTVTIINVGGDAAAGVVFNDTPDANTTLVIGSATTTQGTVRLGNNPGDTSVRVRMGDVLPGGNVTITFEVTINDPLVPPNTNVIINQGTIRGDNFENQVTDDADTPNPGDETITVIGKIPYIEAYKSVELTDDVNGDGHASPGDILTYTVRIDNLGNVAARHIEFTDTPDPNTALVIGSVVVSDPTATVAQDTGLSIQIPKLAKSSSVEIRFDVRINDPLPQGVTQVANQGLVQGNNFPPELTDDDDTSADDDETRIDLESLLPGESTPTTQILVFDPAISKIGILEEGGLGLVGEKLTWKFTISNIGTAAGTDLVISDTIASEMRVDGAAIDLGSYAINGQDVTFYIPILNPGQTIYAYIYTTVLENPLEVDNTATLSGSGVNISASAHISGIASLPSTGYPPEEQKAAQLPVRWIVAGCLMFAAVGIFVWKWRRAYSPR